MALAVCLLFDPSGDRVVRALWARLEAEGVPSLASHTHGRHRPHLSYVVARSWDIDRLREELAALPDEGPFDLWFQGTVVFPRGRAALAASVSAEVARRQQAVAEAAAASGADLHRHYAPGRWVPHVSVATRGNGLQLPRITRAVNDALPLTVRVTSAALVDSGTGELWPLPLIP